MKNCRNSLLFYCHAKHSDISRGSSHVRCYLFLAWPYYGSLSPHNLDWSKIKLRSILKTVWLIFEKTLSHLNSKRVLLIRSVVSICISYIINSILIVSYFSAAFFLIGIYFMQGWAATMRHGVTRKEAQKRLPDTKNLCRKNLQLIDVC